jgi:hypothetical protein
LNGFGLISLCRYQYKINPKRDQGETGTEGEGVPDFLAGLCTKVVARPLDPAIKNQPRWLKLNNLTMSLFYMAAKKKKDLVGFPIWEKVTEKQTWKAADHRSKRLKGSRGSLPWEMISHRPGNFRCR